MFADSAKITIRSGKGGDGHVSFRRELYVAAGGPDGGDGGRGGDLIFEVDPRVNTLNDFRHIRKYFAGDGEPGGKRRCHGADGEDMVVHVPEGTVVREAETGKVIIDMSHEHKREVVLKGGRGGKGNMNYATPTMQVPKYAQPGKPGRELEVILELKTIADVGLIGFPNVGKSTLLNQILKTKLAIMSDVAQTTRNTIQGIYTDNEAQIIFMDTPGIHKPQDGLGNFMNTTALNSIYGVDMVLFIAPANETIGRGDRFIIERLKEADGPVFLLLNKCDLVSKDEVIKKLTEWKELFDFKEIIPISALEDQNVDTLISTIKTYLNEGMMYYPKDQMTDHPERFVMAEFIREKILYFTREEVPHSVAIVVERMAELEDGSVEVIATIVVDRKSQKGILIGKQGSMIKKIRQNAQREMKRFLQTTVHLELFVKVENNWRNKQKYLKEFGYNEDDY